MEVRRLDTPDPMTGCVLDHTTIDTKRLIGDEGLTWSRCPFCNVIVEPAMRGDGPIGPAWGKGRGELVARVMDRLQAWKGYITHLGGDGAP
jgi:hypothetical protein